MWHTSRRAEDKLEFHYRCPDKLYRVQHPDTSPTASLLTLGVTLAGPPARHLLTYGLLRGTLSAEGLPSGDMPAEERLKQVASSSFQCKFSQQEISYKRLAADGLPAGGLLQEVCFMLVCVHVACLQAVCLQVVCLQVVCLKAAFMPKACFRQFGTGGLFPDITRKRLAPGDLLASRILVCRRLTCRRHACRKFDCKRLTVLPTGMPAGVLLPADCLQEVCLQ